VTASCLLAVIPAGCAAGCAAAELRANPLVSVAPELNRLTVARAEVASLIEARDARPVRSYLAGGGSVVNHGAPGWLSTDGLRAFGAAFGQFAAGVGLDPEWLQRLGQLAASAA
jgi:hypothetical protein